MESVVTRTRPHAIQRTTSPQVLYLHCVMPPRITLALPHSLDSGRLSFLAETKFASKHGFIGTRTRNLPSFLSHKVRGQPHPTLTPQAGSCADYTEARLNRLAAVFSGRRLEHADSFAQDKCRGRTHQISCQFGAVHSPPYSHAPLALSYHQDATAEAYGRLQAVSAIKRAVPMYHSARLPTNHRTALDFHPV